jgi:hypothetical protein
VSDGERLDRGGENKDRRELRPDLTEDEALVMRSVSERDPTYVQHLTDEETLRALSGLAEKGYASMSFSEKDPKTGEWRKVRPPWSLRSRIARWLKR